MDDIKFVFELLDKASGNAKKIASAVQELEAQLKGTKGATAESEKGFLAWAGQFVKIRNEISFAIDPIRIATGALTSLASAAIGTAEAIASTAFDAGKFAVDALAFKESTLASFKLILGTEEAADRIFKKAVDYGAKTPFETKQVIDAFKQLLGAGFNEEQVPVLFQAIGDVAAASGFSPEVMPHITAQLAQVHAQGKLVFEDLRQIVNWTGRAGVGYDKVYAAIGERLGVDYQSIASARMLTIMVPEEVRRLAAEGVSFELHTHTHRTPDTPAHFDEEISRNRTLIESMTSSPARHFCYPSGRYRPEFLTWLQHKQVITATTCDPGLASHRSNPLQLPRFIDLSAVTPIEFEGWVTGASTFVSRHRSYAATG